MKVVGPADPEALADARRSFKDVPLVHVGSLMADGTPHVVPLWFVWLDDAIVVSCRDASQVWVNLRRDPSVALEFERGRAWHEHTGMLVRGRAEPVEPDDATGKRALSAWFEKYREHLAGSGFALYSEQVAVPRLFRMRSRSVAGWRHGPAGSPGAR